MSTAILAGCTGADNRANPLLTEWDTPYGVPPFDRIRLEDYRPAVEQLIAEGRRTVDGIAAQTDSATFENTIVALEFAQQPLERTLNVFYNLNSAETSDSMQALAIELSPLLTEFTNDIMLDERLFARVKSVYDAAAGDFAGLTAEQRTLLEETYKNFVRSGANLTPEQKAEYRAVTGELAQLTLRFEQNLLAATNGWQLHLTDSADLAGLPESVRDPAAAEAGSAGMQGWLFTLHAPSYIPFMTYSERRDLRERMYRAYNSRAYGGEHDNGPVLVRIADLRLRLANLLGYRTYADYALEERMAGTVGRVDSLLDELLARTKPYAEREVAGIEAYAAEQGLEGPLMPWDWAFYTEKYKAAAYDLDDEMTRPYFRLERVQDALFLLAGRLYGLTFKENRDIPVYHPDVHAFEVYDAERGSDSDGPMAVLYIDYFPRPGKQGGAWMTSFRQTYTDPQSGEQVIPVVSLVCNFTKPTGKRPSLLSFNEVTTIFHEFGHGLHGMLGRGSYPGLTGTNVRRDFVELPSQIMENWVGEKEFLDLWAAHYLTGEKMPAGLIDKIEASKRYLAAYSCVRQLQFGFCDMAWHTIAEPLGASCDVAAFERQATERTRVMPPVEGTCFSTGFGHIFGGGYAAGYYSYKWAEVLEADAYAKFKGNGIFDRATALSFRENILTPGGSEHPMTLYVRFAGHEPTVGPLLEKMGIPADAPGGQKSSR
ncbi:M3 family metallopeptidase [uncultured Rikenella sp.]|uniref:M3 family metallopeptidase n=1 Tax=uncultured Rikenella sp. TaxID=368003 RepID=UPI00262F7B64|nr:M3 family metallopeptidase [uncultured Rikenella sp.]